MKERVGQKIKLTNYEALLGVSNEESAVDVSIRGIHSFENHPFKVIDDDKMLDGILNGMATMQSPFHLKCRLTLGEVVVVVEEEKGQMDNEISFSLSIKYRKGGE